MPRYKQKKSAVLIILIALLIVAAGGAVYFYLDRESVSREITAIDTFEYTDLLAEKAQQYELKGIPLSAQINEQLSDNTYQTPHGFSIVSYSNKWKGEKLIEIYEELLKNTHGDEMMYVGEVSVYPGASDLDSDDTSIAGTQSSRHDNYPVFFDIPALIPDTLKYNIRPKVSVIALYNMDKYDNASQAAKTIAHEYGHHYTIYHFLKNNEAALESEYYNIRKLRETGKKVIYENWDEYMENYNWDIYELAAEDYVQLMGSPSARKTAKYKDVKQFSSEKSYRPKADENLINLNPQNNIYLPLADEVAGLRDYYYSFIGKENELEPIEDADFKLRIEKAGEYYNIRWAKTSTDKKALYTLVCYKKNGELFWPVKTINGNETPVAAVGKYTVRKDYDDHYTLTTWNDYITDEDRIFKLYLILPDGRMQSSEPFRVNF